MHRALVVDDHPFIRSTVCMLLRQQRLLFNHTEEARDAYFARLDRLMKQGFIDASEA